MPLVRTNATVVSRRRDPDSGIVEVGLRFHDLRNRQHTVVLRSLNAPSVRNRLQPVVVLYDPADPANTMRPAPAAGTSRPDAPHSPVRRYRRLALTLGAAAVGLLLFIAVVIAVGIHEANRTQDQCQSTGSSQGVKCSQATPTTVASPPSGLTVSPPAGTAPPAVPLSPQTP